MTALFVPALRIMGEHLPERAELSWCRSRPEPGKKGTEPDPALHLLGRPACSALQMQAMCPSKTSSDKIAALWILESL